MLNIRWPRRAANRAAGIDLPQPRVDSTVPVTGRRQLSFAEFGHRDGRAVIWLHGSPGSRLQIPGTARRFALDRGLRLVGLDRPGVGRSTAHTYPTVASFVEDLISVMNSLDIDRADVVGLSGGGPFALAAGALIPERVGRLGILGGVAPARGEDAVPGGMVSLAARLAPLIQPTLVPLGASISGVLRVAYPLASVCLDAYALISPAADRRILHDPEVRAMVIEAVVAEGRHQFSAPLADVIALSRPWGFRLHDVQVPVQWWHGDGDPIVPHDHGLQVVRALPDATMHTLAGENHLVCFTIAAEALEGLVAGGGRPPKPRPT